jgi:hypothetical protein
MSYLATTCTTTEIDAEITRKWADSSNTYFTTDDVKSARNNAIIGLYPKFKLKSYDETLVTLDATNEYSLPAAISAVGDDSVVAMAIDGVFKPDYEVWNGKLITPRYSGFWGTPGVKIRLYYTKPFTVPADGATLDVPPLLQPLVVLKSCITLVDKKLVEANKGLSAHYYALKRQWQTEADRMEADLEGYQKSLSVAGEMQYDGGHGRLS